MGELRRFEEVGAIGEKAHKEGKKIVFTNGVFDILHLGHLNYLEESKKLGDLLVIGVNSDRSTRSIKGQGRPLNRERDRALLLAGFRCVDIVFLFDEESPLEAIRKLRPDFLVKGSDYTIEEIVGKKEVEAHGGEVRRIPLLEGYSTSFLLQKISDAVNSSDRH